MLDSRLRCESWLVLAIDRAPNQRQRTPVERPKRTAFSPVHINFVMAVWRFKKRISGRLRLLKNTVDLFLGHGQNHARAKSVRLLPELPPDPLPAGLTVNEGLVHTKKETHENTNYVYLCERRTDDSVFLRKKGSTDAVRDANADSVKRERYSRGPA